MDHIERRWRILVALALYWCLHMIMQHVLDMHCASIGTQQRMGKCPDFEHLL